MVRRLQKFWLRKNKHNLSFLGCAISSLPFNYLGVLVRKNRALKKHWKLVIDRLQSKLSNWKSKSLSFGVRLILIKDAFSSLPTYYFSLFKILGCIINYVEKKQNAVLWGSVDSSEKIHRVSWTKVLASRSKGGIGVGNL